MTAKAVRESLAIAVIALALSLMLYYQVSILAPMQPHTGFTFTAHGRRLYFPRLPADAGRVDLQKRWAPRVLGNIVGTLLTKDCVEATGLHTGRFSHRVGLYASAWLGVIFLLYLVTLRGNSLIPILGTFCGVSFGYMPGIADRIYPWDMPALFFFSLFICFLIVGRVKWFLVILPLAVLFKETVCVLAFGYLFVDGSVRKRCLWFAVALILGGVAKVVEPNHPVGWRTRS